MHADLTPDQATSAVLNVLAGAHLEQAAAHAGMSSADLADAVEVYHTGGQAALQAHGASRDWFTVRIQPTDWDTAEYAAATHLGPQLLQAQRAGELTAWWFVRKHPCWRLRLHPGPTATIAELKVVFGAILNSLTEAGVLDQWWTVIYEPEILAFGGPRATDIAHNLFHTDSRRILDYLRHLDPAARPEDILRRREMSVLLCTTLFRAASQDWYEQADIWDRVARMRPLPAGIPTNRLPSMAEKLRWLMTVDTDQLVDSGPLAFVTPWSAGFRNAGRDLADAAHHGALLRGVRDVLAHHVIFHWNRLGLSATTQAILAQAARDAIMNPSHPEDGR
ncbi:MAG: thiopeptide-type bacteriocin biosynthesis protein [Pseudonocardiaceae bacterium]